MSLSTQLSSVKEGKKDDACVISSVVTAQDPCRNGVELSDSGWIDLLFSGDWWGVLLREEYALVGLLHPEPDEYALLGLEYKRGMGEKDAFEPE
jgi:hypothetical protein